MPLLRSWLTALAALAVVLLLGSAPAQAANPNISGKTTNRYGTTRFSVESNTLVKLTISKRIARRSARRVFALSCRTRRGKYQPLISFTSFESTRRFNGLANLDDLSGPPYVCRAQRGKLVFATMRVRRR